MASRIEICARDWADAHGQAQVDAALKELREAVLEAGCWPGAAQKWRQAAKAQYESEGQIEIDEDAVVSLGEDGGAYVAAWVWVDATNSGGNKP